VSKQEKFHSAASKPLWLEKQVWSDLGPGIVFVTTSVRKCGSSDWKK